MDKRTKPYIEEEMEQDVLFLQADEYFAEEQDYIEYMMSLMEEKKTDIEYIEYEEVTNNSLQLPF